VYNHVCRTHSVMRETHPGVSNYANVSIKSLYVCFTQRGVASACVRVCVCVCVCVHRRACTRARTYTHTHTHTRAFKLGLLLLNNLMGPKFGIDSLIS
jgi:hypothetical protein